MSQETIDLLKIGGSFLGALFGGLGAFFTKEYIERRRSRTREFQTRWLPS